MPELRNDQPLRERTAEVIFGHETRAGKAYNVALIAVIVGSVLVVSLESVATLAHSWGPELRAAEWAFTAVFTIDYLARLWCAPRRAAYARSLLGVIDLVATLPSFISLLFPGGQALITVRALRLLRIFRVLKLVEYVSEAKALTLALQRSRRKVIVFIATVASLVVVLGSVMYLVEGPEHGFSSIPNSIYWAIVTLTTVGYGDIAPKTALGKGVASLVMLIGYGIIAVPTSIVTVELARTREPAAARRTCPRCGLAEHAVEARYCLRCGEALFGPAGPSGMAGP